MRYLIRLITPKDGIVLDPFNGSGSTGKAAMLEGKNYIGIDLSDDYIKISEARIKSAKKQYDAEADKNKHFETFE
jgi:site-specific DNA-methyltransferase (adenine-specific)